MIPVKQTCDRCGGWVDTIQRAADDTAVTVNAPPSPHGDWMRVTSGADRGKYIRLGGPVLQQARAEGVILYVTHEEVCGRG